jgi:hypothetical protein
MGGGGWGASMGGGGWGRFDSLNLLWFAPVNRYAGWVGGMFPRDSEGATSESWEGSLHVGELGSESGSVSRDQFRAQTKQHNL